MTALALIASQASLTLTSPVGGKMVLQAKKDVSLTLSVGGVPGAQGPAGPVGPPRPGRNIFMASSVAGSGPIMAVTDGLEALSATVQFVFIVLPADITGPETIKFDSYAVLPLQRWSGANAQAGDVIGGIPYVLAVTNSYAKLAWGGASI